MRRRVLFLDVQPDHGETVIEVINKILGRAAGTGLRRPARQAGDWRYWLNAGTYRAGTRGKHPFLRYGEEYPGSGFLFTRWRGSVPETTMISVRPPPPRCGPAQRTHLFPVTRPMYIRQTGQATGAGCIARADFEARQRAARTDETTYVVQGWRQGNGTLWQPNQRVIGLIWSVVSTIPNCLFRKSHSTRTRTAP